MKFKRNMGPVGRKVRGSLGSIAVLVGILALLDIIPIKAVWTITLIITGTISVVQGALGT